MAPPKKNPTSSNPPAAKTPAPEAPGPKLGEGQKELLHGTFCDLGKYGGEDGKWGIKVEEDGDIQPGFMVEARRRDLGVKVYEIDEVLYEDSYKVVCTFKPDPNDRPPGGRQGTVRRKPMDMGGADGEGRGERAGRGGQLSDGDLERRPRALRRRPATGSPGSHGLRRGLREHRRGSHRPGPPGLPEAHRQRLRRVSGARTPARSDS
jgi:hypothetical protein